MVTALKAQIGTGVPDPACWLLSHPVWLFSSSCPPRPLLLSGGFKLKMPFRDHFCNKCGACCKNRLALNELAGTGRVS
jgi:hypothetical protein